MTTFLPVQSSSVRPMMLRACGRLISRCAVRQWMSWSPTAAGWRWLNRAGCNWRPSGAVHWRCWPGRHGRGANSLRLRRAGACVERHRLHVRHDGSL